MILVWLVVILVRLGARDDQPAWTAGCALTFAGLAGVYLVARPAWWWLLAAVCARACYEAIDDLADALASGRCFRNWRQRCDECGAGGHRLTAWAEDPRYGVCPCGHCCAHR